MKKFFSLFLSLICILTVCISAVAAESPGQDNPAPASDLDLPYLYGTFMEDAKAPQYYTRTAGYQSSFGGLTFDGQTYYLKVVNPDHAEVDSGKVIPMSEAEKKEILSKILTDSNIIDKMLPVVEIMYVSYSYGELEAANNAIIAALGDRERNPDLFGGFIDDAYNRVMVLLMRRENKTFAEQIADFKANVYDAPFLTFDQVEDIYADTVAEGTEEEEIPLISPRYTPLGVGQRIGSQGQSAVIAFPAMGLGTGFITTFHGHNTNGYYVNQYGYPNNYYGYIESVGGLVDACFVRTFDNTTVSVPTNWVPYFGEYPVYEAPNYIYPSVTKYGGLSGNTTGTIRSSTGNSISPKGYTMSNMYISTYKSAPGDSGSPILVNGTTLVGMHVSSNGTYGYAHRLDRILNDLGVGYYYNGY